MKAIIVGAGPCGLFLGHALDAAGITDYVILERRPAVVENIGVTMVLWPHTLRLYDQLNTGLYEKALSWMPKMERHLSYNNSGKCVQDMSFYGYVEENHGVSIGFFERKKVVQMLFESLPRATERIKVNKTVTDITQDANSATVTCADGTSYTADIVFGADGIHSTVRKLLFPPVPRAVPTFKITYKIIFGISRLTKTIQPFQTLNCSGNGAVIQCITDEDSSCWILYVPLTRAEKKAQAKKGDGSQSNRYTREDIEKVIEKYKDLTVHADPKDRKNRTTLADIWAALSPDRTPGMVDGHEGMAKHDWHKGRVVLVGESVCKMIPYLGLGVNTCFQHVVSVVNKVRSLQQLAPRDRPVPDSETDGRSQSPVSDRTVNSTPISTENWEAIWRIAQAEHKEKAEYALHRSHWVVSHIELLQFVMSVLKVVYPSYVDDRSPADKHYSKFIVGGLPFDFLPRQKHKDGRIPFRHQPAGKAPATDVVVNITAKLLNVKGVAV